MLFGDLVVVGNLTAASSEGIMSQTSGTALSVNGTTELVAYNGSDGWYDITLDNLGNAFNNLTVEGDNVSLSDRDTLNIASADIKGDLTLALGTAGVSGGISQTGLMTVSGATRFTAHTATDQTAALADYENLFAGSVTFNIANGGSWQSVDVLAGDDLDVSLDVDGNSSLNTTNGGNVTIDGNTDSLTIVSTGTTHFGGGITTLGAGGLDVISDGDVSQSNRLDVTGPSTFTVTGADRHVDLTGFENTFGGPGSFEVANGGSWQSVDVLAGDDLDVSLDVDGSSSLNTTNGGNVTIDGNTDSLTIVSTGTTHFGGGITTVGAGGLDVISDGDVSQSNRLDVTGPSTFTVTGADRHVDLTGFENTFGGPGSFEVANGGSWQSVDVLAGDDLDVSLDVDGSSSLNTTNGGNVTIDGNTDSLTIVSTGTTHFGGGITTVGAGGLDVISDGDVSQSNRLDVTGPSTFTVTGADRHVDLTGFENTFGGPGSFEVANGGSWQSVDVLAGDDLYVSLDVVGTNSLTTTNGGNVIVDGSSDGLIVISSGSTQFGPATTSIGATGLVVRSAGAITQTAVVNVSGTADLSSKNDQILLTDLNISNVITINDDITELDMLNPLEPVPLNTEGTGSENEFNPPDVLNSMGSTETSVVETKNAGGPESTDNGVAADDTGITDEPEMTDDGTAADSAATTDELKTTEDRGGADDAGAVPKGDAAVSFSGGTVSMTFADGTVVGGISMPGVSISMQDKTLSIARPQSTNNSEPGAATTLSIVILKEGAAPVSAGSYVVVDGEQELTVMPFEGSRAAENSPGDALVELTFSVEDDQGNDIPFTVALSEYDLQITPKNKLAAKLEEARPDLIVALAIVELQKHQDVAIDDIETVFFRL